MSDTKRISAELAELRKEGLVLIRGMRKKKFKWIETLIEGFTGTTHFVFEFLQNAEDAGATFVRFELSANELSIRHNGKPFNKKDVESITTAGSSDKEKEGGDNIGKFGIGFKSVFKITDSPIIHSGVYHFKIKKILTPKEIEDPGIGADTLFILPLHADKAEEIAQQINKEFEETRGENLLFLKNIKKIIFSHNGNEQILSKEVVRTFPAGHKGISAAAEVVIKGNAGGQSFLLVKSDRETSGTNHRAQLAFYWEDNRPAKYQGGKNVFVFFPTADSGLDFLIQAPYKTPPDRQRIPFGDKENLVITESVVELVADSLPFLRDNGFLTADFFGVLPFDKNIEGELYQTIRDAVIKKLLKDRLIPGQDGGYLYAEKSLYGDAEIIDLISPEEVQDGMQRVAPGFPVAARDVLSIQQFGLAELAEKVTEAFMADKTYEWLERFYGIIVTKSPYTKNDRVHPLFSNKPIIRLQNDGYVPHKAGVYKPYDPPKESEFNIIDVELLKDEYPNAQKLLTKILKIQAPQEADEIKKFILPKYSTENPQISEEEHFKNIEQIVKFYGSLRYYLDSKYLILTEDGAYRQPPEQIRSFLGGERRGEDDAYRQPSEQIFLSTGVLREWFGGNEETALAKIPEDNAGQIKSMLKDLDCSESLKYNTGKYRGRAIVEHYGHQDHYYTKSKGDFNPNFNIYGLDFALKNINPERSKILWDMLLKNHTRIKGTIVYSSLKTFMDTKTSVNGEKEGVESKALQTIKQHPWLYGKGDDSAPIPADALGGCSSEVLHEMYGIKDANKSVVDSVVRVLGMQSTQPTPEEWSAFQKEKQQKDAEHARQIADKDQTIAEQARIIAEYRGKNQHSSPHSYSGGVSGGGTTSEPVAECKPEDAKPVTKVAETPPRPRPRSSDGGGSSSGTEGTGGHDGGDKDNETAKELPDGKRGEKIVYLALKTEFPAEAGYSVMWVSDGAPHHEGYDIRIEKDGEPPVYIEVKSTEGGSPCTFKISGAQWDMARRCHNGEISGQYQIRAVFNVYSKTPTIAVLENPVGKFNTSELDVRPLGLRIK